LRQNRNTKSIIRNLRKIRDAFIFKLKTVIRGIGMETCLTEDEFSILNFLDVFKSIMDIDSVQVSTGLETEKIKSILAKFLEKRYVEKEINEERETWKITYTGEGFVNSYRQFMLTQTGQKEAVIKKCEEFEELNVKFKELVTSWQMKIIDGIPIINDHSDPEYDFTILNQIFSLHECVIKTLEDLANFIIMYKNYIRRLNFAIKKLKEGEYNYLTKDKNSYHNVWFELHESILKLWGKERME
jgi:predicted transcriptional regulator